MSSSDTSADAATIVAIFDSLYTGGYCGAAASVLFIYDAIITFDREVASFWAAKWTAASLLFFANKWLSLTFYVMLLVDFAPFPSDKSCSLFNIATLVVGALQFIPWAVFSALRAYVLSRSKLLGLLILALSMTQVAANLVPFGYQTSGENVPPFGCLGIDNTTDALNIRFYFHFHRIVSDGSTDLVIRLTIIARVPLIVADILLIYITWAKLSNRDALRDIRKSRRASLSDVLFRDGTIYFVVLFILNVLHLVLSVTAVASDGEESFVTIFTTPITAILVSHFLLDLQEANRAVIRVEPDDPLHSSRDHYDDPPSFISSIGFVNPNHPVSHDSNSELYVGSHADGEAEGDPGVTAVASSSSA